MSTHHHTSPRLAALIDLIYVLEAERGPRVTDFLLEYAEKKLIDIREEHQKRPFTPITTAPPTPAPPASPLELQGLVPVTADSPEFDEIQRLNAHNLALLDKANKEKLKAIMGEKTTAELQQLQTELTGEIGPPQVDEKFLNVVNEAVGCYNIRAAPDEDGNSVARDVTVIKVYKEPELFTVGQFMTTHEVGQVVAQAESLPASVRVREVRHRKSSPGRTIASPRGNWPWTPKSYDRSPTGLLLCCHCQVIGS